MTLLSKVKTLIEYARFGMGLFQMFLRDDNKPGFLYFPQKFNLITLDNTITLARNNYISSIKGRITSFYAFGYTNHCEYMTNLEEVDLPECVSFYAPYGFNHCTKLHTVKLPLITTLESTATFDSCTALKYLEVGKMEKMSSNALLRCANLETFVISKGSTGSLYLHYCENLTQECLHNIIDNLAMTNGSTLQVGEVNIAKISDEYKIKLINEKHWNLK